MFFELLNKEFEDVPLFSSEKYIVWFILILKQKGKCKKTEKKY